MSNPLTVAVPGDATRIADLIEETVHTVYPHFYPPAVVDFFLAHHSIAHIAADIARGDVRHMLVNGILVGTGSVRENEIRRVFIAPCFRGKGYGAQMMDALEDEITWMHAEARLDASLPACKFYERLGYTCRQHESESVPGGAVLVYAKMKKPLMHIEMTDANDARFQLLCGALDEHLNGALGKDTQRTFYNQYNKNYDMLAVALAVKDSETFGCGAIKAHDTTTAELKRMFVLSAYRGKSVGKQIIRALENDARARGFERLILETGTALIPAQKRYLHEGFRIIENYGQYRGLATSVCMEKKL